MLVGDWSCALWGCRLGQFHTRLAQVRLSVRQPCLSVCLSVCMACSFAVAAPYSAWIASVRIIVFWVLVLLKCDAAEIWQSAHADREKSKADVVVLIVPSSQYCGMARPGPHISRKFCVVGWNLATGHLSSAHEVMRSLACNHDCVTSTDSLGLSPLMVIAVSVSMLTLVTSAK